MSNLFALTRHGAIGEVGSLERCLIIFHALRLLWVMLVDVMTSSLLFFHVVHKCITSLYGTIVKWGSLAYCFLYFSYRLFDSSDWVYGLFYIVVESDSSDRPGIWFVLHPRGCGLCINNIYKLT